jgi:XTP/dITP diphosphohydrolase
VAEKSGAGKAGKKGKAAAGGGSAEEPIRLVLATRNRHKVDEIRAALGLREVVIECLDDYPDVGEIVEDGSTFEANARIKAMTVARATGRPALGDDSGLMVDALGGEPGVRSARWSGPEATDASNRAKLVEELGKAGKGGKGTKGAKGGGEEAGPWTARFVCALCLATPDGFVRTVEGRCEGTLLTEERGSSGFGYDPLFVPEGHDRTFAEMTREEKTELSHRGRALRKARKAFGPLIRGAA